MPQDSPHQTTTQIGTPGSTAALTVALREAPAQQGRCPGDEIMLDAKDAGTETK
jgi:hypothetical protein